MAGTDIHAISLAVPFVYWAPAEFGVTLSQIFNNNVSKAHLQHPDRLIGLATLPMQAPLLAVTELERASKLPGIRGVCIATNIGGKNLDDKSFWPVYAKCEQLGLPIFLHSPMNPVGAERMGNYHLRNLLGNPYDEGIAAASLIFGGVMDAYPKLDIVFSHAGGAFPALVGRMDHGAAVRKEATLPQPPSKYLRRFYFDIITHNDEILMNLIRQAGPDRIVLGSDHPADMGHMVPAEVVERLPGLTAAERDLIMGGNASRLLKLH
ncbi:MAG: hypothetical protein JW384_03817 [Nitrosomonadaceae bacterium]|nr:hypothetical protein [Nitrosomonadaceae bacterium]